MRKIVLAVALVTAACGTAADDEPSATTTSLLATATSTVPAATTTIASSTTSTSTTVPDPPPAVWDVWTLILGSFDVDESGSWDDAVTLADRFDRAQVIDSSDYPSLNPGYWAVSWGEYESGDAAKAWCDGIPTEIDCYPRYLGEDISPLAADGNALVIDGQELKVVDVETGERLKTFDPYFDGDGLFVGRMALTPDGRALYFSVGFEDSWYSCEASQGGVWKLDLDFGITTVIGEGFGAAVSPDGKWMATLFSEQCLPDPENPDLWVLTPTDTVILYDLTSGWPSEAKRWSVQTPPTSYEQPQVLIWLDWRADSQSIVALNTGGDLYEKAIDTGGSLEDGSLIAAGVFGYPQALIGEVLYLTIDETPFAVGTFDLVGFDLATGTAEEILLISETWNYAAADTQRRQLIWGSSESGVFTESEPAFAVEEWLAGLAW